MPDKKLNDKEIVKEIQGIKESMKRHIDLTNEMGQDLLRIDEEYTGGSKVWLTTDYFKKVVKHFSHSNYLVKCLELVFDYINRLQADYDRLQKAYLRNQEIFAEQSLENERLKVEIDFYKHSPMVTLFEQWKKETKAEAYKEFAERLKKETYILNHSGIDNLLKEMVGDSGETVGNNF